MYILHLSSSSVEIQRRAIRLNKLLASNVMSLLGLAAWNSSLPNANVTADNIDYDDIKHFIKEHTTPGQGKSVSVPGRGDDKLVEFENALFHILADQHQRIDLFVKSKSGEIQRRLGELDLHAVRVVVVMVSSC